MRGAGFPMPPQSIMPIAGQHMAQVPFQTQPPQWVQHQQAAGLGMMMGQGWNSSGQTMFPPHGLASGLMTMPVGALMGNLGPAPPPHPPPPLPAEPPPPPPPSTPKDKVNL